MIRGGPKVSATSATYESLCDFRYLRKSLRLPLRFSTYFYAEQITKHETRSTTKICKTYLSFLTIGDAILLVANT